MDEQFGPYRIEGLVARGGMGEVLRAYDTRHDRVVALKVLAEDLSGDAEFRQRFTTEARVVARLREAHVIPIHSYGEIDGRLYLDMRLVDGEDVGRTLRAGGLMTPARAVDVISQIAQALDAAHADGLVHRDVKPSNIMLSDSGFAYLVDFGITHSPESKQDLTSDGSAIGTADYMAPERIQRGTVDGRADVYSLACVLFECLTGRKPYLRDSTIALLGAHIHEPPPRPSMYLDVPLGLDAVIRTGMAKQPEQRFATAGELAAAARDALAVPAVPAPPPEPPTALLPPVPRAVLVPPPTAPEPMLPLAPAPPPARSRAGWLAVVAVVLAAALVTVGVMLVRSVPGQAMAGEQASSAAPPASRPLAPSSSARVSTVTVPPRGSARVPATDGGPVEVSNRQGDLGLGTPVRNLVCDGRSIVVTASSVDPGSYRDEVSGFLAAAPGSSYLYGPGTGCGSLRTRMPDGSAVYTVYYGPYASTAAACAKLASVGGDAYLKRLDDVSPVGEYVGCD